MLIRLKAMEDEGSGEGSMAMLDLYRWLRQDPDVRGRAELSMAPDASGDAGQRTMSGAGDVINLVLEHTFSALNLALAYAAWRTARPTAPAITITTGGTSVTVRGADEETVARIVQLINGSSDRDSGAGR
ncbi:effector-associated constant component EACC1 [Streptomyces sp. NPDC002643]